MRNEVVLVTSKLVNAKWRWVDKNGTVLRVRSKVNRRWLWYSFHPYDMRFISRIGKRDSMFFLVYIPNSPPHSQEAGAYFELMLTEECKLERLLYKEGRVTNKSSATRQGRANLMNPREAKDSWIQNLRGIVQHVVENGIEESSMNSVHQIFEWVDGFNKRCLDVIPRICYCCQKVLPETKMALGRCPSFSRGQPI